MSGPRRRATKAGPTKAMVLAAGLGTRLAPITHHTPKPLVPVAGRTLLDRGLDQLQRAGVTTAIVNVHHLGQQIITHCAKRARPKLIISDERDRLRDSAGAIVKALPLLGPKPFYILNADTFWLDVEGVALEAMRAKWDGRRMDMLLMLVLPENAIGHHGGGDFAIDAAGRLRRAEPAEKQAAPIYAGVAIVKPRLFADAPETPHSLNLYFNRLITAGRLFGSVMAQPWITVGTPEGLAEAEEAVRRRGHSVQDD
jgi:N-acetyl-alpha-D-muramate 1-phosphate uridylyltransferase